MEPGAKSEGRPIWLVLLVGLSFVMAVSGVSLPFILADQVFLTWPTEGYVSCQAGEATLIGFYLYDYGDWLWFRASHPPLAIKLDDPDLHVVQFDIRPVAQGVFRQTKFVELMVLVSSPGKHTIRSITIETVQKKRVIELGPVVLDATDAVDPHLIGAFTDTVTGTIVSGTREQNLNFFVESVSDVGVQVGVSGEKSPPFLTLVPWTPADLGPRETVFTGLAFRLADPQPRDRAETRMYLWRPWLVVRTGDSQYRVPGPLIQLILPG